MLPLSTLIMPAELASLDMVRVEEVELLEPAMPTEFPHWQQVVQLVVHEAMSTLLLARLLVPGLAILLPLLRRVLMNSLLLTQTLARSESYMMLLARRLDIPV